MKATKLPKREVFYQWKKYVTVDGALGPRFLTPWADPKEYEFPMDWCFDSVMEAEQTKRELGPEEEWFLVKVTYKPIKFYPGEVNEDGE